MAKAGGDFIRLRGICRGEAARRGSGSQGTETAAESTGRFHSDSDFEFRTPTLNPILSQARVRVRV